MHLPLWSDTDVISCEAQIAGAFNFIATEMGHPGKKAYIIVLP
jgi:hypothetical protein